MKIFIVLVVICLVGAGIYLFFWLSNQPIDKSQLKQITQSVDQTASEGKLLAEVASGSRPTNNYIQEQSKQLSDQLTPLNKQLTSKSAQPDVKSQVNQQVNLIQTTQELLKKIGDSSGDSSKLHLLDQKLQTVSNQEEKYGK